MDNKRPERPTTGHSVPRTNENDLFNSLTQALPPQAAKKSLPRSFDFESPFLARPNGHAGKAAMEAQHLRAGSSVSENENYTHRRTKLDNHSEESQDAEDGQRSPLPDKLDKGEALLTGLSDFSAAAAALDPPQSRTTTFSPHAAAFGDTIAGQSNSALRQHAPASTSTALQSAKSQRLRFPPPFARPGELNRQAGELVRRPVAVEELYAYHIEVLSPRPISQPLSQHEETEVRQLFKEHVGMNDDKKHRLLTVNGNMVLTLEPIPDFQKRFIVNVCAPSEHRGVDKPRPGPEWRRAYIGMSLDGKTEKQWMKVGKLEDVPPDFELTTQDVGPDNRAIDSAAVKESLDAYYQHLGRKVTDRWDSTAMVFARESLVTVDKLCRLDCWATTQERSLLQQIQNTWITNQVLQQDKGASLIRGNKVYGEAQPLECGVEKRDGMKLKLELNVTEGKCITQKPVHQHFFRPVLVSEFLVDFYGSKGINLNDHQVITGLTSMLKGVQVFTSGGGLRTKPIAIKAIDSRTAAQIGIPVRKSATGTTTLSAHYEHVLSRPLRYAGLPCVNVGTAGRDFYLPAEACLIVPNQPFKGAPLPLNGFDASFKLRKPKQLDPVRSNAPLGGLNPFQNVEALKFEVIFAEVTIMPADFTPKVSSANRRIAELDWSAFKQAIGQRYGKKLEAVVGRRPDIISLPYYPGGDPTEAWRKLLRAAKHEFQPSGKEVVLIVAIPEGNLFRDMHRHVRSVCDIALGIQCNIVKSSTLSQVCKPGSGDELRGYSGQLVRKTFARALIPGTDHSAGDEYRRKFASDVDTVSKDDRGLLIAINVSKLVGPERRAAETVYLVTITSHAGWLEKNQFYTSHAVASIEIGKSLDSLPRKIAQCVKKHVGLASNTQDNPNNLSQATHIVYYRSGAEAESRVQVSEEVYLLAFNTNNRLFPNLDLHEHITYVKEPGMTLAGDLAKDQEHVDCLVREVQGTKFKREMELLTDGEYDLQTADMAHLYGLDAALLKHYARSFSDLEQSRKTYLVTNCRQSDDFGPSRVGQRSEDQVQKDKHLVSALGRQLSYRSVANQRGFVFHSMLKHVALPDMLFLVDQAAKRMMLYITPGHGTDVDGKYTHFVVPEIHKDLRHSLYFL